MDAASLIDPPLIAVAGRRRPHWGQPEPSWSCCRVMPTPLPGRVLSVRRCYDPRCSLCCRQSWAKRESVVDLAVWERRIGDGLIWVYAANWKLLGDPTRDDHADVRSRLLASLRGLDQEVLIRAVSEVGRDDRLHDHAIVASDEPLTKAAFRELVDAAAKGQAGRFHFSEVDSIEAAVRYQYKAMTEVDAGLRVVRLHRPRTRLPVVWGVRGFTPGGAAARKRTWIETVRRWKGDAWVETVPTTTTTNRAEPVAEQPEQSVIEPEPVADLAVAEDAAAARELGGQAEGDAPRSVATPPPIRTPSPASPVGRRPEDDARIHSCGFATEYRMSIIRESGSTRGPPTSLQICREVAHETTASDRHPSGRGSAATHSLRRT